MGESQGRHDDDEAGRLADDEAGLSYPDKRDCGVSQRAKENDHEFHELNELTWVQVPHNNNISIKKEL